MPRQATPRRPARWTPEVQTRAEQFDLKRRAVILAAGRAMAKRGFAAISLDEVAKELNVSKPALYYYVRSKHEILFEFHKLSFELGARCREKALAEGKNGLDKLVIYLKAYITGLIDDLGGGAAMTEYHHLSPEDQKALQPLRDDYDRFYRGLIAEGISDGSIRKVDAKMAVFFVVGAIRGIHRWYNPEGPLSGAQIADAFVDLARGALARTSEKN